MLDLVPFAGSRREMANGYGKFELVGQLLNLDLPQTDTVPVAAPAISRDHQAFGLGIASLAHADPPPPYGIDGEGRRVVIGADAHPPDVVGEIIDAVGHRPRLVGISEVVHVDGLGRPPGSP